MATHADAIDAMSSLYVFQGVPIDALRRLARAAPPVRLPLGVTVFNQDDAADEAFLLLRGHLAVSVRSGSSERPVGDIRPGEVLGEQALFAKRGRRNATVLAREDSLALRLSPSVLEREAHNPAIVALESHLMGAMARRIRKTNLAIQKAWHEERAEATQPERPTFRQRLASLFGGA